MKRFMKIAITVFVLTLLCALAGCGVSADSIAVKESPRTEYVAGQELDLSKGSISVTGGKESEVKLSSSDVKISGYDKNRTGKQTVTVEYGGKTCTFTVTVHARLEAVDYEADYLVGESFDVAKGKLLIYRDDGIAASSVRLDDAAVTVNATPFTQEGSAEVQATYNGETATIAVNVYRPQSEKLFAPNKLAYKSHETELDLSGGYLVVTANEGKLVRKTVLTPQLVTGGFDPSAATADNLETPLKQTVTVRFLEKDYSFEVSVAYSYVTYIKACASELAGVAPENVTAEQGDDAIRAISGYFGLSAADKALLSDAEIETAVRAAAVYGKKKWNDTFAAYGNTLALDEKGNCTFRAGTYEQARADHAAFSAECDSIAALSDGLNNMAEELGQVRLADGREISAYIGNVMPSRDVAAIPVKLAYMFELYDKCRAVPADWTQDETAVEDALLCIWGSAYQDFSCADMYDAVSSWCGKGDLFDVFYAYCYEGKHTDLLRVVCNIRLPEQFAVLYDTIAAALECLYDLDDFASSDTTDFMWLYTLASQSARALNDSDDAQTKWLYENMQFGFKNAYLPFKGLIAYLEIAQNGYYENCRGALGDEDFDGLWDGYLAVVADNYKNDAVDVAAVKTLLTRFVNASPSVQYAFLASIHPHYNYFPHCNAIPEHALDPSEETAHTQFTAFVLQDYATARLSAKSRAIFFDLMEAAEDYALRYYGGKKKDGTEVDYKAEFLQKMQSAQQKYQALSADEKTAFDAELGFFYDKYVRIYELYNADGTMKPVELGEWKDAFDALSRVIENVSLGYELIGGGVYAYGSLAAGYEYAQSLANAILRSGDAVAIDAYYYADSYATMSFDCAMYALRESYVKTLTEEDIWETYRRSNLQDFMAASSPVMQMFVNWLYNEKDESCFGAQNKENVLRAIDAFYKLDASDKVLFYLIDSTQVLNGNDIFVYDAALNGYFAEQLSNKAYAAAMALFDWETYYTMYEYNGRKAEDLAKLDKAVADFNARYEACGADDKAAFDEYFAEMYAYYKTAYETIAAA